MTVNNFELFSLAKSVCKYIESLIMLWQSNKNLSTHVFGLHFDVHSHDTYDFVISNFKLHHQII